ncbi:MAG: hypothetical protein FWH37_00745 [Candidatus Bathyarchaeota archaeon]|nr:hypothetical protein [Candidatus Termiticorpusculum sp.]
MPKIEKIELWIKNSIVYYEHSQEKSTYVKYITQPREDDAYYYTHKKMREIQRLDLSLNSDEKYDAYLQEEENNYNIVWKPEAERSFDKDYKQNIAKDIVDRYNARINKYGAFFNKMK